MKEIEEFFFFFLIILYQFELGFLHMYVPFEKYTNMNIRFRFAFSKMFMHAICHFVHIYMSF